MKNESNTGNSQHVIHRISAFAVGLFLATSLPAGAVSVVKAPTYGSPLASVSFSSPAGEGGFDATHTPYMQINPINVWGVPGNNDPNWSEFQQLIIDWKLYYWNSALHKWVAPPWQNNGTSKDIVYSSRDGSYRSYKPFGLKRFNVTPGYFYTLVMRVSWAQCVDLCPNGHGPVMAAGYYFFDQVGDLRCVGSAYPAYNCQSYTRTAATGLDMSPPNGTDSLYIYYGY
jgi:hypothetical protein